MRLRLGDLGCKIEDEEIISDLVARSSPANLRLDLKIVSDIYRNSF